MKIKEKVQVQTQVKDEDKPFRLLELYQVVGYPLIFIVDGFIILLGLFNVIPFINAIGIRAYASDLDQFAIYYPSFIVLDIFVGWLILKIVEFVTDVINSFMKKHIVVKKKEKKEKI